jgi:hypothetical protein
LSKPDALFQAADILGTLDVTASELGYRVQAMLGATLKYLPGVVDVVAATGHPDLVARTRGRTFRLQVKVTRQRSFCLERADLDGIRPTSADDEGYIALLDMGPPLTWIWVPYLRATVLVGRPVPLAMLRSMEDQVLSSQCSEVFAELVLEYRDRLEALTYSLVRRRALADISEDS